MRTKRTPTKFQQDVLGIVAENGPLTPQDLAYHLPIGVESARGVLARLEAKSLVEAVYTGHHRGGGRAYVVNERARPSGHTSHS